MAHKNNHLVIMAGGVGSRFWPMSTEEKPKQFIDVLGTGRTLLQLTFDRFEGICDPENVWVVTNKKYAALVQEQLPEIPAGNIVQEPCRRNTAPCVAYISWRIKEKDPNANIVVSPTRPETGYGYIQGDLRTPSARNKEVYRVDQFHEKPDLETAKKYLSDKNFFWNAGIFIMSAATIVNAFRVYQPAIAKIFESLRPIYGTPQEQEQIDLRYPECENISIDYAIMEKAEEIFVFPASFGWSDLGTWGSLLAQSRRDLYGNATIGKNIQMIESKNNIVHTLNEKKVVIQGLEGYIVAEEDGTLLICKMSEEQRIKQFSGMN